MANKPTIRERLATIEQKVDNLVNGFNNHLQHHRTTELALITALLLVLTNIICRIAYKIIETVKVGG